MLRLRAQIWVMNSIEYGQNDDFDFYARHKITFCIATNREKIKSLVIAHCYFVFWVWIKAFAVESISFFTSVKIEHFFFVRIHCNWLSSNQIRFSVQLQVPSLLLQINHKANVQSIERKMGSFSHTFFFQLAWRLQCKQIECVVINETTQLQ